MAMIMDVKEATWKTVLNLSLKTRRCHWSNLPIQCNRRHMRHQGGSFPRSHYHGLRKGPCKQRGCSVEGRSKSTGLGFHWCRRVCIPVLFKWDIHGSLWTTSITVSLRLDTGAMVEPSTGWWRTHGVRVGARRGYIRMQRDIDAKEGLCGIAMDSSYPTA